MCVWAALHIQYAVSCMQTACSIVSADLEGFVLNTHILPCTHIAIFSSQQCPKKFFENPSGEMYLKFVAKSNFLVTQSLLLRKSLLKWAYTKLKKILQTGGKVDSQEHWNVIAGTWLKLKRLSQVVHRRFYTLWNMRKLYCDMRRELSESWYLQLNKSEISEMVRSWNCCRMFSATSKVHYYMRNCKEVLLFYCFWPVLQFWFVHCPPFPLRLHSSALPAPPLLKFEQVSVSLHHKSPEGRFSGLACVAHGKPFSVSVDVLLHLCLGWVLLPLWKASLSSCCFLLQWVQLLEAATYGLSSWRPKPVDQSILFWTPNADFLLMFWQHPGFQLSLLESTALHSGSPASLRSNRNMLGIIDAKSEASSDTYLRGLALVTDSQSHRAVSISS